jgi:hypothetical protein
MTDYPPVEPDWELYDLVNDPAEMNNIYNDPDQQELIKELKYKMLDLKKEYDCEDEKYLELVKVNNKYFW